MFKRLRFLIGLIVALATAGTASAQGPIGPQHSDPGWQATYWNNTALSGPPALQRAEGDLNYDWGTGSPAPGVNADGFSARWTRYIDVTPGTYRFTVTTDDGMRLWVDNELLIDQWRDQAPATFSASKYLGPGHHLVRVEYYEDFGGAVARVSWTQGTPPPPPPPTPPPGYGNWRGEYFNNKSLSGAPALVRNEPYIQFNWGTGSPAPGWVAADGFSVRWSRTLALPAGSYRFTMTVDDGARLFVNGHTLIDAWKDQAATTYTGDIYLPGGTTTLQMEYYENVGSAVAQLAWTSGTQPPPPPPPPPTGRIGYVTVYQLNVRSGPGLNYWAVGSLRQGQPVRLLGRNWTCTWLKVEQGWVSAAYIWTNVRLADLPVVR